MNDILIIDGNLFARKAFYKFKNLSTKISNLDLAKISPKFRKNLSSNKEETIEKINKTTGKSTNVYPKGRIESKIDQIISEKEKIAMGTGTAYGVLRSLISLYRKYSFSKIIVCYDPMKRSRKKSLRISLSPAYKASRELNSRRKKEETILFYDQLSLLQYIIYNLGITQIWTRDFEADDLLEYFAKKVYKNENCLLLTSDHDLYQVIDSKNSILFIGTNPHIFTEKDFYNKFKIESNQYLDVMSLCGCSGDDVSGLKGIGEMTAINLIKKFGSLKGLLLNYRKNKDKIKPKTFAILEEDRKDKFEIIKKTRKLVRLYGTSPNFKKRIITKNGKKNLKKVFKILEILNFKSFLGDKEKETLREIANLQN